jgi:predicted TIM-barrel fold metal-dependent hydrolase
MKTDRTDDRAAPHAVIDCDIHHDTGMGRIKPYLPRAYRELTDTYGNAVPGGDPRDGVADVQTLRQAYLDERPLACGILTGTNYGVQAAPNYEYAVELCRAINTYTVDHWLGEDARLKGSIIIPKQQPVYAAKEIDRMAPHPGMVQVLVSNGAFMPYGNRFYDPIYEACERHGLPLTIHAGMEGVGINNPMTGVGYVTTRAEWIFSRTQVMMAHVASMIFEGVFERFPTLRVVLQEAGVFWIVPYLWRLDQDWRGLRVQTPWVKRFPSEYFREHFRITTQTVELPNNANLQDELLRQIDAERTLMFASNYPYGDEAAQAAIWSNERDSLKRQVMGNTAAELYGI